MNVDLIYRLIDDAGYWALFIQLALGLFGLPLPHEIVVMTGGAAASSGLFYPIAAFATIYMGLAVALTVGYSIGRWIGVKLLARLRNKKYSRYIRFTERLMGKYGSFALCISSFFPVVRHLMPILAGTNRMRFKRFALFAYAPALVWTSIYFTIGFQAGDQVQDLWSYISTTGLKWVWLPCVLAAIYVIALLSRKIKAARLWKPNRMERHSFKR
ncbi:DedA family protein [Paenibacillus oceani]|uniref:DedA family protein n=1 Tax=Paenibacillus oceani TaxID=2772510 RepID=A0A927GYU8_9BACL|nr:DedA family protein [Paenibacillus oceani]MBD2861965.1 DedA family protein [Paenibacillus oceani]